MKQPLFILVFSILLVSCSQSDNTRSSQDSTSLKHKMDVASSKTERKLLIEALERMKVVIASKEKEQIASLFTFPLPDSIAAVYTDDTTYRNKLEQNGNNITRQMFVSFFPQVAESFQFEDLDQLFRTVQLQRLHQKDTVNAEVHITTEPCYKYYQIEVKENVVTLTMGQGVNRNYKSNSTSEDEVPENSSEMYESSLWWELKFDGKKLHLIRITGAG